VSHPDETLTVSEPESGDIFGDYKYRGRAPGSADKRNMRHNYQAEIKTL